MSVSITGQTPYSGSLFYYDVSNSKSYVGEPTTNLVNPLWSQWMVDASGYSTMGAMEIISPYHCRIIDSGSNTRPSIWVEGISPNSTYTFSVKYKKTYGTPTLRYQIQPHNGDSYITAYFPTTAQIGIVDVEGWQTATYTVTAPASSSRFRWFVQDGDDYTGYTHEFELKEAQVEMKTHATTFVSGSRSNTRGLFDLCRIHTIDLSNLLYDSGSNMVFNGSTTYIPLSSISDSFWNTGSWSVNVWAKFASVSRGDDNAILGHGYTAQSNGIHLCERSSKIYFGLYGNDLNGNASVSANTWYNITWTFNHITGLKSIYINGSLDSSGGDSGYTGTGTNTEIGRYPWGTSHVLSGSLRMMCLYNRTLSSPEIFKIFNRTRSSYGY